MRRILIGTLTVLLLTLTTAAVQQVSFAQPSGVGTYYKTYTGTNFTPLHGTDTVRWASGTGGGVWVQSHPIAGAMYLEVRLDLPSGAQVTEMTFYVRNCETGPDAPQLYAGAYAPATAGYTALVPEFAAPTGSCGVTQSLVQAIDPPVTVDNAQRVYVIGYKPNLYYPLQDNYDSNLVTTLLVGARVTYQMPGAFLPLVTR